MENAVNGYYRLSWRERIGFCSGDLAQNLIYQTVSIWLLFYYNNVYGLDSHSHVNLILVSTKDNERMDNNRYGGVDAGYVSQNIYLACTALGLHTVARAMMDKEAVKRELKLADTSIVLLNHPIGFGK